MLPDSCPDLICHVIDGADHMVFGLLRSVSKYVYIYMYVNPDQTIANSTEWELHVLGSKI